MEPTNPGQFASAIGGQGGAIAEAMSRRGMDESVLNQVTPGAATSPERGLPQPIGANPPSAVPPQGQALPAQGSPNGLPPSESMTLVKALDSRLKTLGKLQESGIQV